MTAPTRDRLPSIDGWRALCLAMVLASHCHGYAGFRHLLGGRHLPLLLDGHLAVRMFFVISGFLITYLLIREHDRRGTVSLRNFYIRRALRILPVYGAFLLVIALLQVKGIAGQPAVTWLSSLLFVVNFLPRGHLSGHLWSLSVEEQFYLLWPLAFVWMMRQRPALLPWLAAPCVVAPVCRAVGAAGVLPDLLDPLFHHHSSMVNFDALALGCLAAFAFTRRPAWIHSLSRGAAGAATLLAATSLLVAPTLPKVLPPAVAIAGPTAQAAGFAVLLVLSISRPEWFPGWNWKPVTAIGVVSYSVYIWQQLFWALPCEYGFPPNPWMGFPGWIATALAAGTLSYHCLEKPLLGLRHRLRATSGASTPVPAAGEA